MMMEQTLENTLLFEVFDWKSQETLSQLRKFLKDVIYLDVQNSKTNNLGVVKLAYTSLFLNDL